jgi:two-component system phosphate regulon sensor histidine kinase PhoR
MDGEVRGARSLARISAPRKGSALGLRIRPFARGGFVARLAAAFFLYALLLLVPLGLFLHGRLETILREEVALRQAGELSVLEGALVAAGSAAFDPATSDSVLDALAGASAGRVTLVARDGRVLADSRIDGARLAALENHALRPEIRAARAGEDGVATRYSTSVGRGLVYRARLLRDDTGRPAGWLRIALSDERVDAETRRAGGVLLTALAGALLLAAGAAFVTARGLTRPIRDLRRAADALARGELGREIRLGTGDELEELAGDFNRMSRELARSRDATVAERDRLAAVLDAMVEGVLVVDAAGRILQANPAFDRLFGLARTPVGRTTLESLRNPAVEDVLHAALSRGERGAGFVRLARPVERTLEVAAAPLGAPARTGAVAVFHEVTRLERLEALRRDFVAGVTHEIRTPVTAIRGWAETLRDAGEDPAERARFADVIVRQADRLARLVDDLLILSSVESGGYRLRPERLPAGDLLRAALEAFEPRAREAGIALTVSSPEAAVLGDRRLLDQAIANLVDNALRHTERGGRVELRAEASGEDRVRIAVRDTGCGIPPEDLDRVFERFFRVDRARGRRAGGAGLGLALVKHVAAVHGGRVEVRSRVGEGSEFALVLPAARGPAAPPPPAGEGGATLRAGAGASRPSGGPPGGGAPPRPRSAAASGPPARAGVRRAPRRARRPRAPGAPRARRRGARAQGG